MTVAPGQPLILGLETSCDETSAAVLDGENRLLGHVILSQDVHEVYGGVVPELAARAHLQKIDSVVAEALARAGVGLDDITVEAQADPGEAEVVVDPVSIQVRLSGARSIVTSLDPERLRVWVPPEMLDGMEPGEEHLVRVQIEGVPELVTAVPGTDRVTVRRAMDQPGAPTPQGAP